MISKLANIASIFYHFLYFMLFVTNEIIIQNKMSSKQQNKQTLTYVD